MTLKQLKYLVGIADSGLNITSAAERLFTSQPGISKQLKQLEAELGVQLFTRKGKSLAAITPAGREVIARARKILREVGNITSLASDLTAELDGTLSIATTHTQARYVLPEVIRAFRERYPRVDLELHQGTSEQIAELISTNKVDFAIATGSQDLFSHLTLMPIYHWHRIVLVPKGHPLAKQPKPLDLQALADHPLVTYVFSGTGESSFKRAFREQGLEPRVVFTARDADIIKTYVRMGMGVGVIASMAFECSDREDLVAIDASELFPRVTTWLGFPRDMVLRGYMVDFVHLFAPHYSQRLIRDAARAQTQEEVNELLKEVALPLKAGCEQERRRRCHREADRGLLGRRDRELASRAAESRVDYKSARLISWMPHSRFKPLKRVSSSGGDLVQRLGAVLVADRHVALLPEWVIRQVVLREVTMHVAVGPFGDRMHFPPAAGPLEKRNLLAALGLVAAQAREPSADVELA